MKVITGTAKGMRLESLPGEDTRPTAGRVKEAMMSVIQFEIENATILDLFAGTGQLGIEALSRGAKDCVFIEKSSKAEAIIQSNLKQTKLAEKARVYKADALSWIARNHGSFDIAFVDPPYDLGLLPKVLPLLVPLMQSSGIIVCESSNEEALPEHVGSFSFVKEYGYGKRKISTYRNLELAQ